MKKLEYLDNGVKVFQDDGLYAFTSDAIKLSRFATVKSGDAVADFCAGSGVVGFNLYALNPEKVRSVTFFEMEKPLSDLCAESIAENGLTESFTAVCGRVQDIGEGFYGKFSLVVCNPPYMKDGAGEKSAKTPAAKAETALTLGELFRAVSLALKFGGRAAIVHRADRLTDVMCAMRAAGIEPKRLAPLSAAGKEPYAVLVEGVKGGKSGLKLLNAVYN